MENKKLTDRELIAAVLDWYDDKQTSEQLRELVGSYVDQSVAVAPQAIHSSSFEFAQNETRLEPRLEPALATAIASVDSQPRLVDRKFEAHEVVPYQQFDASEEPIGVGGGIMIDVWGLYYGIEDFIARISFGLLTMQGVAILFCVLIGTGVMIGAWQSSLSTERLKKPAFKSIVIEPPKGVREPSDLPELRTPPIEADSLGGNSDDNSIDNSADSPSPMTADVASTPTMFKSDSFKLEAIVFDGVLNLMEKAAWDEALENLQTLENDNRPERQPMLSMLKVEALIQKRDKDSMELARIHLMDCKFGEFELAYDLLVTRWMLLCSSQDRVKFLREAASLPESCRERMSTWAKVRNGNKEPLTEAALETNAASAKFDVCDRLFLASFHYSVGKSDMTTSELLDTQDKLRVLKPTGKSKVESWLLETAKVQLVSKVDEILASVDRNNRKPSRQIH